MATGLPFLLPSQIPPPGVDNGSGGPPGGRADQFSLYDVAIGGIGFEYATSAENPMLRQTVPYEKNRIDQEQTPGEQTLTGWWIRSQDSFHGGAGQLNLEPSAPGPLAHVRYDVSKNVDVSVPGRVTRLPDTVQVSNLSPDALLAVPVAGADALVILHSGVVTLLTALDTTPVPTSCNLGGGTAQAITTDGTWIYVAHGTGIIKVDPANPASAPVDIALYPAAVTPAHPPALGWCKARLMLGLNESLYAVDPTVTGYTLVDATDLLYRHPTDGWTWTAFTTAPTAIMAAGHSGGLSSVTQLNEQNVSGAPVLQVSGESAFMPLGEIILSMITTMGTFIAFGTNRGIRIGSFDTYYSRLSYGPLALTPADPLIPARALAARDHFVYAAGLDYDEAGLMCLDMGTHTDEAGRYAWSPSLITPTSLPGVAATTTAMTPSMRIAFGVPSHGVYLEGTTPGTHREAWLRTSRMRFATTEPKLFKMGRVRGNFLTGSVKISTSTPSATAAVVTVGFTTTDPDEFRLPTGLAEWLQYRFDLSGAAVSLTSYQAKALPATPRQRFIRLVLAVYDSETTKIGQRIRDRLSARARLAALEALDAAGDEVVLQEFTPSGVVSTVAVIDSVQFTQIGRPTRTSDLGGTVVVQLRTVEQ